MRQSLLAVVAVFLVLAFSGCIVNPSPEAEAQIVEALTGDDEGADKDAAEPEPQATTPTPEEETPAEVVQAPAVVETAAPAPTIAPRKTFVVTDDASAALLQARPAMPLIFANTPPPAGPGPALQWPVDEPEEVPVVEIPDSLDVTKGWAMSEGGVEEFAMGCSSDGGDCAFFDLPAGSVDKQYTFVFGGAVPAAVYYIDTYSGGDFVETIIVDPGVIVYTGTVPAGITQFHTYATGGMDLLARLIMGEDDPVCPTDFEAVAAGLLYFSETGGGQWVYAESNGIPGVQRDDESFPTACSTPDTLIF